MKQLLIILLAIFCYCEVVAAELGFLKNYEIYMCNSSFRLAKYDFGGNMFFGNLVTQNKHVDAFHMTTDSLIVEWYSVDSEVPLQYGIDYFDFKMNLIKSLSIGLGSVMSPNGEYQIKDNTYSLVTGNIVLEDYSKRYGSKRNIVFQRGEDVFLYNLDSKEKIVVGTANNMWKGYAEAYPSLERPQTTLFLRDNERIVYQNEKKEIYTYNIKSGQAEKLATLDIKVVFRDIAYHHPWILCSTNEAIYIFDYEKKELRKVKQYDAPGWDAFLRVAYTNGVPRLLGYNFLWRDDDEGFLFEKFEYPWLFDLTWIILSPVDYKSATPYYFDLGEGKEYRIQDEYPNFPNLGRSAQWRRTDI